MTRIPGLQSSVFCKDARPSVDAAEIRLAKVTFLNHNGEQWEEERRDQYRFECH